MNEKGEVTTNTKEIQMILKTYYEQLYRNKLHNVEEMDTFLESHKLPKLEQEEIENLNRPITREDIEAVIQNHTYLTKPVWKDSKRWSTSKFVL